jgi:putative transposase
MTVMRGVKIKLSPTPEQAKCMDRWRRASISLWNLLLGIEQAAYDGSKFRPELRWRKIWDQVTRDDYENAVHVWKYGKKTKDGTEKKKAGDGKEPVEPIHEHYQRIAGYYINREAPKIFIWESELQKIMARLKENPLTHWINDLPSHSSQQICKDVVKAIKTMLSEKKKRAQGKGLNTGFPRFKKMRYASGSVYMVNSQTIFDHKNRRVKLPKLKTTVIFRQQSGILHGELQGGRIWREGEQWWISCQYKIPDPKKLPKTGRECGLKIAAGVLATTFDGKIVQQTPRIEKDRDLERRVNLANRRLARRSRGTNDYYKTADEVVTQHAVGRNRRSDMLHKVSREIVNSFDAITVHNTDFKSLMVKKKINKKTGDVDKTPKNIIKMNRDAAMAQFKGFIVYKGAEAGRTLNETHANFPEVQKCSHCGKLHYMPLEKRVLKCECGNTVDRRANAAINEFEQGQIVKAAGKL